MLTKDSIKKTMLDADAWLKDSRSNQCFLDNTPYKAKDQDSKAYKIFLRYRIDKSQERCADVQKTDLVMPGETDSRRLMSALLNYVNDTIWYNDNPDTMTLIRYLKAFELARFAGDIVYGTMIEHADPNNQLVKSFIEKQTIICHLLMEFADAWLDSTIGWSPFKGFHETDEMLTRNLCAPFATTKQDSDTSTTSIAPSIAFVPNTADRPISWSRFVDTKTNEPAT